MRWNTATTEDFRRVIGAMAASTVVSASPVALVVLLVAIVRRFAVSGNLDAEGVGAVAEGRMLSGLVIATSATLAGPVWVGMVAGIVLALFARKLGREVDVVALMRSIFDAACGTPQRPALAMGAFRKGRAVV